MMDASSLLVCVCVFVCSGVLLLAISFLGVRERSYDELLAERRAMTQGSQPKRPQDKRTKKQGRKPKEKERPHVEFQDAPIVASQHQNNKVYTYTPYYNTITSGWPRTKVTCILIFPARNYPFSYLNPFARHSSYKIE